MKRLAAMVVAVLLAPHAAFAACAAGDQWFAFDHPPPARPGGQELIRGRLVNSGPVFEQAAKGQAAWLYPNAWLTLVGVIDAKISGFGVVKALPVYAVVNACTPGDIGRRGRPYDRQVYLSGAVYRQGDTPVFVASSFRDGSGGKQLSLKSGAWLVEPWGAGVNPWASRR